MSEESKREREITFKRIREKANGKMSDSIVNCNILAKSLGLGEINIPNIIITYNNKIIAIEKEFNKAGIDFYDRFQCESRFIIEQRLQAYILNATNCLTKFTTLLNISKEQVDEFVASYKKPTFIEKTFKGAKYEPKKDLLTLEQKEKARIYLSSFKSYDKFIQNFTIKDDMIEAILFGRILSTTNGITNFDERLSKIDSELQKLGYNSILDIVQLQLETQDLSFSNIYNLISVSIPD